MNPLTAYFHAERSESLGFVGAGLAGIIVAIFWWMKSDSAILHGAGWPLITLGVIQLIVGAVIRLRTPRQVAHLTQLLGESAEMFRIEELERMHAVSQNFIRVRWTEIALFILSSLMMLMYFPTKGFGLGFAIALAFESAFMLLLDFFAEERAEDYRHFVRRVG